MIFSQNERIYELIFLFKNNFCKMTDILGQKHHRVARGFLGQKHHKVARGFLRAFRPQF
jgi:hypothetical protein